MKTKAIKNTIFASLGGILEFYDFVLFVFFTSVFAQVFFPPDDAFWANVGVWTSFGAGYLARPFGAMVFAHFGDVKGRKNVFYISMLMMILPSFALAFLPSYESIGLFATISLFLIRIVQGLAVGAEISGAWVFVSEFVSEKYKSLALGFISATLTFGLLLAGLVSLWINVNFSTEEIKDYAFRLPFILGGVFGILACFLRTKLNETPEFERLKKNQELLKFPLIEALKTHKLPMLVCVLMSFILSSGLATLTIIPKHFDMFMGDEVQKLLYSNFAIVAVILGSFIQGALASFFGNFKICIIFSILFACFGFALSLYDENFLLYYLLACFMQGIISFAPIFMTAVFKSSLRFSGLSFAYNVSYALIVYITPFVIDQIYDHYLGYYFILVALASLFCVFLVKKIQERV
ncbi:MFS transporter [Campylobacter sp. MIT 99-7217]|uniref:MFS transporter n=1 Tax=Campylobacter sp. MIT 99-7217 TaxID=535091 RepID=UPI0011572CA9|nr:MFS transporter [Campylobacter sp. MIT 99-7217]TQR32996.1 MFS transporter [Campylobacter sp. MIT 99-7217]